MVTGRGICEKLKQTLDKIRAALIGIVTVRNITYRYEAMVVCASVVNNLGDYLD
jgi:hypothetical protein